MLINNLYSNINYLTGAVNYPSPQDLPEESEKTYTYDDFFSQIFGELNAFNSPKERLNHFLSKLTLIRPDNQSSGLQAECWISKEFPNKKAFLHLVVEAGSYYSTIFPSDPESKTKYIYLNLAEWEPNPTGGNRHEPLVQMRIDLESGKGEWMWIRNSPSFSGTEAITFAQNFSQQFLTEAEMWDTAKIKENNREISLATWGLVSRAKPEFLYSRAGFQVPTVSIDIKEKTRKFVQHKDLHSGAVHYLRNLSIKTIKTALSKRNDQKSIQNLARKYECPESTSLTTLCQKVDQACRKKIQNSVEDKLFLYDLVSGEHKISSKKIKAAIRLAASAPLLRASYPFTHESVPFDINSVSLFEKTYNSSKKRIDLIKKDEAPKKPVMKMISQKFSLAMYKNSELPKRDRHTRFSLVLGALNQGSILRQINQAIATK